jgi:hypothetical protein
MIWGFDHCFLLGRIDGCDLPPLDLCKWFCDYAPKADLDIIYSSILEDSHLRFSTGCEEDINTAKKIYLCDMLSATSIFCLGDVCSENEPEPCSILTWSPCCSDEDTCNSKLGNCNHKAVFRSIPKATGDGQSYLDLDDCGCIVQKKDVPVGSVIRYQVRDSYPSNPDWEFIMGSFGYENSAVPAETVDIQLAQKIEQLAPAFKNWDLEVTIDWTWEFVITDSFASKNSGQYNYNAASFNFFQVGNDVSNPEQEGVKVQGWTYLPWGSLEFSASKTIVVPKAYNADGSPKVGNLVWKNSVTVRKTGANPLTNPTYDGVHIADSVVKDVFPWCASRVHAVYVTVKPVNYLGGIHGN